MGLARHDATFDPLIAGSRRESGRNDAARHRVAQADGPRQQAHRLQDRRLDRRHDRRLGVPARYVSGYLRNDDPELHVGRTSHSWAEAWVPGLEWVGFDPANDMSPRGDSLRVAVGLDYRDAAPVSGRRVGFGEAKMSVEAAIRLIDP